MESERKVSIVDAFSIAASRFLTERKYMLVPEVKNIHFYGFKPSQTSTEVIGHLVGRDGGNWVGVEIVIRLEDIQVCITKQDTYDLIDSLFTAAFKEINDKYEDPFDKWVKEVRAEGG